MGEGSDGGSATARAGHHGNQHGRSERARQAVLEAADDLLAERGFAGVTIEGIAARAGVAKQTIYRWWPSKVEVLLDTLAEDAAAPLAAPDTGSVREDLRVHLHALARFLAEEPSGKVLLALIGHAQHDAEMAAAFRGDFVASQRDRDRALLQRGVERGELPAGTRVDDALDALYGPVF